MGGEGSGGNRKGLGQKNFYGGKKRVRKGFAGLNTQVFVVKLDDDGVPVWYPKHCKLCSEAELKCAYAIEKYAVSAVKALTKKLKQNKGV